MASTDAPPEPQGAAPDKPHHPPDPSLNFTWLYILIISIFAIAVGVKILAVIIKKRRDKRYDPAIEMQNLEFFKKHWFPWRYKPDGTIRATGESPLTTDTSGLPQTPRQVYYRNSVLNRLVSNRKTRHRKTDLENQGDPVLMSGALGSDFGPSTNLSSTDDRLNRAGVTNGSTTSLLTTKGLDPAATSKGIMTSPTGAPQLPPVNTGGIIDSEIMINPYTGKPGRPGPLPRLSAENNQFNSSRFNDNEFVRSVANDGPNSAAANQQTFTSGVLEGEINGYGAPPAWEREHSRQESNESNITKWPEGPASESDSTPSREPSRSDTQPKDTKYCSPSSSRGTTAQASSSCTSSQPSYLRPTASSSRLPSSHESSSKAPATPSSRPWNEDRLRAAHKLGIQQGREIREQEKAARKAGMSRHDYVESLKTPEQKEEERKAKEEAKRVREEKRMMWSEVKRPASVDEAFQKEMEARKKKKEERKGGFRDLMGGRKKN